MVAMVVMVVMFPTRCEKCQRQKIYTGRNITPITTIATMLAGPFWRFRLRVIPTASFVCWLRFWIA